MSFNQAQQEAVSHNEGPCLVLAGPGSGKTLTIVGRIQKLIQTYHVSPEEILVITFTKYAAVEMKNRFFSAMKGTRPAVTFGTFHGIYYGILKWAYRFGPENILSEEEKRQMLLQIVNRKEIDEFEEEDFLKEIISEIGIVKNNGLKIEEYETTICGKETIREIYREYERKRNEERKIDFDDMLLLCRDLFIKRPDILKKWQEKFRYILIDEFQDINQVQYDVIRMLAAPENNLFVVGDDDQSIYGFRGADSRLMFQFQKDFPDAKQLLLDVNYRSSKNIVKNSLKVIANNEVRFDKKIRAWKESGETLHVQEVKDPVEEASYVVEQIKKQMETGILAEEIAVLFRVHTDARAVVEALIDEKIPFQMREHLPNLYNHFIAKDIMAYFRLAMGQRERKDFLQVMNRPKRYLGRDCLPGRVVSFEEMRKFYCDKEWMQDRIDQFEWDLKMLAKMAPYAAIQYLKKKIGYDEFLREYATTKNMKAADLREVLSEIEEAAKPFQTMEEWFVHVEEYTEALKKKEQQKEQNQEGVRLMTLHASKGLEFHTVFLIEANEGRIPYQKAEKEQNVEEERRLFYVGMTRAKDVLKITYVKIKNGKEISPSRFVEELFEGV